jgi:hypothetical protein
MLPIGEASLAVISLVSAGVCGDAGDVTERLLGPGASSCAVWKLEMLANDALLGMPDATFDCAGMMLLAPPMPRPASDDTEAGEASCSFSSRM